MFSPTYILNLLRTRSAFVVSCVTNCPHHGIIRAIVADRIWRSSKFNDRLIFLAEGKGCPSFANRGEPAHENISKEMTIKDSVSRNHAQMFPHLVSVAEPSRISSNILYTVVISDCSKKPTQIKPVNDPAKCIHVGLPLSSP